VAWVRDIAGDRFDQLELGVLVQGVVLTDDRRAAASSLQPLIPQLSVNDVLSSPYGLVGTPRQIGDVLLDRRDRLGVSYYTVFEKDLEAMAAAMQFLKD
jgi:hypothetical protein